MTHPFTPTYIAMTKAAEEIQAMRESFDDGDWLEVKHPEYGASVDVHRDCNPFVEPPETVSWLPRLDQLLGMLGAPVRFFEIAAQWTPERGPSRLRPVEEQDWHEMVLTIVMREKYGKRWDGKVWVKA